VNQNPLFHPICEIDPHKFINRLASCAALTRDALQFRVQKFVPALPVYQPVEFWVDHRNQLREEETNQFLPRAVLIVPFALGGALPCCHNTILPADTGRTLAFSARAN
jgi:hypothetical protein